MFFGAAQPTVLPIYLAIGGGSAKALVRSAGTGQLVIRHGYSLTAGFGWETPAKIMIRGVGVLGLAVNVDYIIQQFTRRADFPTSNRFIGVTFGLFLRQVGKKQTRDP